MKTVPSSRPRAAGAAPVKRDAERTRSRILDAATDEFSANGFDGARVDRIAQRCAVNKNLLYHYFGGKDALFLAVMERMYERMRANHNDLSIKGLDPVAGMRALVRHTFQHFIDEPSVISLLNSENQHRAAHILRSGKIRQMYNPLLATIRDVLKRGQAVGVFRAGVDPVDLYISISGLGYFYLANRHTLGFIFNEDLATPRRIARRHRHIEEVVLGYLCRRAVDKS
jgi:TetR/AcrR family transcriptional regulator